MANATKAKNKRLEPDPENVVEVLSKESISESGSAKRQYTLSAGESVDFLRRCR
jgi:hypothetical protein